MDLGCGRGQDVAKLAYARPRYVLFVDASELALVEAERRWRRTRFAFPAAFVQDDFCSPDGLLARRRIVIYRDDPQRAHGQRHRAITDLECTVKDGSELADAVSCQFALQHAFATRDTARAFVANVVRALKPGGVFVGIVADGASLWRHAQSQEATDRLEAASVLASVASCTPCLGIGGSGVEVRAVQPGRNSSKTTTIGSAHHDRLRSVIVDLPQLPNTTGESGSDRSHVPCALGIRAQGQPCPQYTVMFDDLCDMCTDAGLVLIATSNLTTFFDVESINPRNASMLDRMGAPWRLSNAQDRQHLGLYRTFVFVRQSSTDDAPISSAATPAGAIAPDQDTTTHRTLARAAGRALSYVWSSDVAS
jgi:SAM-dependent methyltransferase